MQCLHCPAAVTRDQSLSVNLQLSGCQLSLQLDMGQADVQGGQQGQEEASSSSSSSSSSNSNSSNSSRCTYLLRCISASGITFQELSGSLGDLGTFLPLIVALAATIGLDLGTTLLFTGLYNIASGVGFRIPMCVQPMKTIAAVALAAPGRADTAVVLCCGCL
ncbi:hypothetical protein COO60DRAFT_840848 [Scenedesmus sp. NREL 46B-D3]|nr:hypothetical protein COO60DRAFT_840848 [Scenedesmus sp. NREL 46B-D3]